MNYKTSVFFLADKACLSKQGKHAEAEKFHRSAAETYTLWYSACDPCTLGAVSNLASCLAAQGRGHEAEPLHRRVAAGLRAALGASNPQTLRAEELLRGAREVPEGTWPSKKPGPILPKTGDRLKICTSKTPARCVSPRVGSPSYKSASPVRPSFRQPWRPAQVLITRAQPPARVRI